MACYERVTRDEEPTPGEQICSGTESMPRDQDGNDLLAPARERGIVRDANRIVHEDMPQASSANCRDAPSQHPRVATTAQNVSKPNLVPFAAAHCLQLLPGTVNGERRDFSQHWDAADMVSVRVGDVDGIKISWVASDRLN